MFAGDRVRDLVIQYLNDTGNAMNIESNAHTSFINIKWGIEAQSDVNGKVRISHLGEDKLLIPQRSNTSSGLFLQTQNVVQGSFICGKGMR
jgi:hypothetical protein